MGILVLSAGRDPILLQTRNEILASIGCSVDPASSGPELINRFFDGDHDLLVLCHSIPREERRKVLRMVKTYRPSMHAVVVGDSVEAEDIPFHLEVRSVSAEPEALIAAVRSYFRPEPQSA